MSFDYYARNGYYASAQARLEGDRMKQLGIKWVCLIVIVLQHSFRSSYELIQLADPFRVPYNRVVAALLLCSDAGAYITGQNLFIDGGLSS